MSNESEGGYDSTESVETEVTESSDENLYTETGDENLYTETGDENLYTETDDGTDWSRTSLTPDEEAIIRDMEKNGELETVETDPELADPEHSAIHLPTENTGTFEGERGNSAFTPNSPEAVDKMSEYGQETVEYKDGDPDFSPFTTHDSQWGEINGQVEIGHMTDQRENGKWEFGRRPQGTSHDHNYDLGNFAQADNAVAEQFKEQGVTGKDIENYRKENNLVWHECSDGKTMQLVPAEIHDACRHSGGVSEMKYRSAWGDIRRSDGDN